MYCVNHSHENGVNTCNKCGSWLCEKCSVEINGRIFCKGCISEKMSGAKIPTDDIRPSSKEKNPSFIILLFFSCILPGLNYMYLGLMKRGLFFLTGFFSIVLLMSITNMGILGIFIPILWITNVFDAFEKRRRIINGIYVEDSIDEIIGWFKKYKTLVVITIIMIFAFSCLSELSFFLRMPFMRGIKPLVSLIILVFGVYYLSKSINKSKDSDDRDSKEQ